MKLRWFRTAFVLPMIFLVPFAIWIGGCASTPPAPERLDSGKIKQDSEKSMRDLKEEETRQHGNGE